MAGFFAAAAKTPFSTLIIVSEMTGGYSLLLPSLWVCTLSFILSDEQSIYSSQVESRSRSPAHQGAYVREVLAGVRVSEFLSPQRPPVVLHSGDPLDTVLDRLEAAVHAILPVVDDRNRLLGVVDLEEVHLASTEPALQPLILAEDLMRTDVRPLTPDDTLDHAQELFVENDLLALPVVDDLKAASGPRHDPAARHRQCLLASRPRTGQRREEDDRILMMDMTMRIRTSCASCKPRTR